MRWLDGITNSMDMNLGKLKRDGDGQGSLACCSSQGCKESDMTQQLNNTTLQIVASLIEEAKRVVFLLVFSLLSLLSFFLSFPVCPMFFLSEIFASQHFRADVTNHREISSVQLLSRVRLCHPMNHSTPGLPVHHQLPEFTQTHVHCVSDAIQPSHPPSSPSPPALNLSQHQGLFK